MPIKNAENFIKQVVRNTDLRKSLYRYPSPSQIMTALKEMGYDFTPYEFEESIRHLKTESPHEEQAIMLDELLIWWKMLLGEVNTAPPSQCTCSPTACGGCKSCP